jgi:hypothetical protein
MRSRSTCKTDHRLKVNRRWFEDLPDALGVKGWLSRALMEPSVHQSPFNPTLQHDQSVERHISLRRWALLHPPADHMAGKPLKSDPEGDIVRASKDRVSGHPRSAFQSGRTPRLTAMSERMLNVRGPEFFGRIGPLPAAELATSIAAAAVAGGQTVRRTRRWPSLMGSFLPVVEIVPPVNPWLRGSVLGTIAGVDGQKCLCRIRRHPRAARMRRDGPDPEARRDLPCHQVCLTCPCLAGFG